MQSTFDKCLRNTLPIIMKCELTFRSGRTRPAHARSSGSETLSRIRFLVGSTIDTLESSFQKRQGRATWQAVANCVNQEAPKYGPRVKRIAGGLGVPSCSDLGEG